MGLAKRGDSPNGPAQQVEWCCVARAPARANAQFYKKPFSVSPLVIARASARGDPLCPKKQTDKTRKIYLETRWIAESLRS